MKKFSAILLCGLLIFNMLGFSVYNIVGYDDQATKESTNADYDLLLKFPLTLPYLSNWQNPEPSNEEILKGNEYYKIVSKQIVNDTLYVQCQFSQTSRERFWSLVSTFDDQIKTAKDAHKGASMSILKNFLKEYMAVGRKHTFYILEWSQTVPFHYLDAPAVTFFRSVTSPPPDLA